jgi:polyisoprenoid-binding protein YceI
LNGTPSGASAGHPQEEVDEPPSSPGIRGALGLAIGGLLATAPVRAEPARFVLDPEHTCTTFFAQHLGHADLAGMFLEADRSFRSDQQARELSDLRIGVRTASVFTNHERRDQHLRSRDFLDVEAFPEMIFEARRAEPLTDTTGRIIGDLTLRGVTRPMMLDVRFNKAGRYPTSTTPSGSMPPAPSTAATSA